MANSSSPCTLTLCHGTHYDLSSLASAKGDYEATVGKTVYKLNVCRNVVSELWNLDDPDTIGGFVGRENGDFSLGQVNTSLFLSPATDEPMIYLQNGSPCAHNPSELASTAIRFICSQSEFSAGSPKLIAALPPGNHEQACHFFFEWETHVACPTNPKASLDKGHVFAFFAILLIAVLTWFMGHTLYNRLYLKRTGLSQFPIPQSLPSLPFMGKSESSPSKPRWGFGRRSQRNGYQGIRADEHDEEEHFAGRFSLDDDDEEDLTGGAEDARALGGEANAWRGQTQGGSQSHPTLGVHRGLEHL